MCFRHLVAKGDDCRFMDDQRSCLLQQSLSQGSWNGTWLRAGKPAEGCLWAPFPFSNRSLTPAPSQTPLVSAFLLVLLVLFVSELHFLPGFKDSCKIHFFPHFSCWGLLISSTDLSCVSGSSEEVTAFQFALRASHPIIHAFIHPSDQGQHPSWAFSASHIFLWLLFYSSWITEYSSCPPSNHIPRVVSELRSKNPTIGKHSPMTLGSNSTWFSW